MAIAITTSDKWAKVITDGGDPVYYSDRRANVYAYPDQDLVIVEPVSNSSKDIQFKASAANTLNGVALPTDPELLAQKLIDDVFFLNRVNGGDGGAAELTEASLLALFQTLPGYAPEKALIINSAGDGLEFVNVQINQL